MTRAPTLFLLLTGAVLAHGAAAATAAANAMAAYFGNTVVVTDRGTGMTGTLALNADQTWTASIAQNGKPVQASGTWQLQADGRTVCLTSTAVGVADTPLTSGCFALGGHAAGERWSAVNDSSQPLDISLMAGQ